MKTQAISEDVQAMEDHRRVSIDQVGVSNLRYPVLMSGVEKNPDASQSVQARLRLSVNLVEERKGIHMSRLLESLSRTREPFTLSTMIDLLEDLRDAQGASRAKVDMRFRYFLSRVAPVSGLSAPQSYACRYVGKLTKKGIRLRQCVKIPVTTLCPCSKAISEYGAHNQRGVIALELFHRLSSAKRTTFIGLEELVDLLETCGSSPLYPLLKRPDERYVTMQAFENPTFVEDVVRNVAVALQKDSRVDRFRVRVENHESIHQHNAFALIDRR